MDKPFTRKGAIRLWNNVKSLIAARDLPSLHFDVETSTLYADKSKVGYDFIVADGRIYYKERVI